MANVNEKRLIFLFKKLVETDSPTFGEREVCNIIKSELNHLGIPAVEDSAGEQIGGSTGNLYAYADGRADLPPLLFCAHMDTVQPAHNKRLIIENDGTLHSDGTTVLGSDDLAGVSAVIEALSVLKESNIEHRPIEILFSVSEENYCKGISHFDFGRLKSKEAYVFDLDGEVGSAAYAAPTILSFTVDMIGKSSHAGFASEKGIHAVKAASLAVCNIGCGKIDGDTTVNVGTISGGTATNIVPDRCTFTGEIRSYSDEKALNQFDIISQTAERAAEKYGAKAIITLERSITAYETDLNSRVVKRFKKVCGDMALNAHLNRSFGGSDNNVLAQNGIDGLVVATAMNSCHTTDEWTTISELKKAAVLALNLMISKD